MKIQDKLRKLDAERMCRNVDCGGTNCGDCPLHFIKEIIRNYKKICPNCGHETEGSE